MRIYIPYIQNPDTYEFDQPLGAFDSFETCKKELESFANEIGIDVDMLVFEITDFVLNENILISSHHVVK